MLTFSKKYWESIDWLTVQYIAENEHYARSLVFFFGWGCLGFFPFFPLHKYFPLAE